MTVVAYGVDHGVDGLLNVVKGDRPASGVLQVLLGIGDFIGYILS